MLEKTAELCENGIIKEVCLNGKKKAGAIVAAAVFCTVMLALLVPVIFAIRVSGEAGIFLWVYAAVIMCTIIGTVIALVLRFKEIKSGEEDEAGKY